MSVFVRVARIPATVLVLCGLASIVRAVDVHIAGQTIPVPAPTGFSEIGKIAPNTFSMFEAVLPVENRLLAVFVSEENVGRLLRGEAPVLDKYMLVDSPKELEESTLTKAQFAGLRTALRRQYAAPTQNAPERMNEAVVKAGKALSRLSGTQVDLTVEGIAPLGIDSETASSITMSLLARYKTLAGNEHVQQVTAGTTTTLLVKGKILHLNVYRVYKDENDLAWTRERSQSWVKSILTTNETTWPTASGAIIPPGTAITSTTKELLSGEWQQYHLKGHPKAQDLNISLKFPKSWKAEEAERPHIVQKFTGPIANGTSPSCMVMVLTPSREQSTSFRDDIADEALTESLKAMIPDGATFIDGGQTKLDGEPSKWLKFSYAAERAGVRVRMYSLQFLMMWREKMLAIQCGVGGIAEGEVLSDAFTSYLPVFQMIGNSIVIHDKWSVNPSPPLDSLMQDRFGEYWLLTIVVSLILTWGIGLVPPLLIRFVIVRRPVSKWLAAMIVGVLLFVNIVVFTALGSQSRTHGALVLVAFVSYVILHRGHKRQRTPRNPVTTECAQPNQLSTVTRIPTHNQQQPTPTQGTAITDYVQHELAKTAVGESEVHADECHTPAYPATCQPTSSQQSATGASVSTTPRRNSQPRLARKWAIRLLILGLMPSAFYGFFRMGTPSLFSAEEFAAKLLGGLICAFFLYLLVMFFAWLRAHLWITEDEDGVSDSDSSHGR